MFQEIQEGFHRIGKYSLNIPQDSMRFHLIPLPSIMLSGCFPGLCDWDIPCYFNCYAIRLKQLFSHNLRIRLFPCVTPLDLLRTWLPVGHMIPTNPLSIFPVLTSHYVWVEKMPRLPQCIYLTNSTPFSNHQPPVSTHCKKVTLHLLAVSLCPLEATP